MFHLMKTVVLTANACHSDKEQQGRRFHDKVWLVAVMLTLTTLLLASTGASAANTVVTFDNPAPPGAPGPLNGIFQGINWGTGQWAWENGYQGDSTNNVFFANSTGTSRTFTFFPAPQTLVSMQVTTDQAGTLTLTDDHNQTKTQSVAVGSFNVVTTGWTQASTTVTVSFTKGWSLAIDNVTYSSSATKSLSATPSSLAFGNVVVNGSSTLSTTIKNTGNVNVTISAASIAGTGYSITSQPTLPLTLAPNATTTYTVQFAPTAAGSSSGNLAITSDATGSPLNVALSGTGAAATKTLAANPTSLGFGNVIVNGSSTLSTTIKNTGNVNVTISAASITGTGYSITSQPTLPLTLAPNATTQYTVQFAPTATGSSSGNLAITSDATGSPLNVALSGTGVTAAASGSPVIFFTDLDSGPNMGGENVGGFAGAYVTLYGNFFGSSQGSSTVTWNGLNCLRVVPATGTYNGWGSTYFWYQKIVVQLGSSCTPGTGNFVVTTAAGSSAGLSFTVRSTGNIFFVATNGNDSTGTGSISSPFATIPRCRDAMAAGDTCYMENGVKATTVDNFDSTLALSSGGTAGNPIAFVGYPGATVTLGASGITYGIRVPNINVNANYVTVAELFFSPSEQGMNPTLSTNWRVIGNNFQCPTANGQDGCFTTNEISSIKFLGNEATNIGVAAASKQQHAVYFSSDTNHVEAAWNFIHNNRSCRAIQFHSSPLGGGGSGDPTGHQQFDLSVHDNLIHDDPCDGINFATIDPSQGKVEAYNNVIYHVGLGPDPSDGEASYNCFYFPQILNNGPAGSGTVELYNNTCYDAGSHVGTFKLSGSYSFSAGPVAIDLRNNLSEQLSGEFYNNSGTAPGGVTVSGSNNLWFGSTVQTAPAFTTGNITSNPLFVNISGNDFHLQSGSPAKDAGLTITSGNSYHGYQVWNGLPEDHDGIVRPQGSAYDIGAYEFH